MNGADTMIATLVKIFNDIAYAEGHAPKKNQETHMKCTIS